MSEPDDLEERQRRLFERFRLDFDFYAPRVLRIRPKAGGMRPFRLNAAQRLVHEKIEKQRAKTGRVRAVILKGRQQGISTYVQGRFFWRVTHSEGVRAFILTHMDSTTDNLFGMTARFLEYAPPEFQPELGASNAKELSFKKLQSGYKVATAGSRGVGVGDTLQLFHGCLGLDTQVICGATGRLRRVGDFDVGDLVRTRVGDVARVSFISSQVKPVKRITVKGMRDFPLVATPEHRFWTVDGWLRVMDLAPGDLLGFPVQAITQDIREVPFGAAPRSRPQGGGMRGHLGPPTVGLTYDVGRIVGLYLAEGCLLRQSVGLRLPAGAVFAVHEREVDRTVAWLEALPEGVVGSISVRPRVGSKTVTVHAYGRGLGEWLLQLVGEKDDKRFPAEWARMGEPFVRGLVHGYLAGDGSFSGERDRRISLTSIRSATVVSLRDAVAALGYGWASISFRGAGEHYGRNCRDAWTFRLTGAGVESLSIELGKPYVARQRADAGNYGTVRVEGGYAWVPIVDIEDAGEAEVRDFEIDHPDHSYCVLHAASHNSEVSKWPNAETHISGALQAVPYEVGTEVILESTSDGPVGVFYDFCIAAEQGQSDYEFIFIPWFMEPGYRREVGPEFEMTGDEVATAAEFGLDAGQMAWRRAKIRELRGLQEFRRQYPATPAEAWKVEAIGALWKRALLDACRVGESQLPPMVRVVVAIDPSGGAGRTNAEVGLVVAGKGTDGRAYVLADASGKYTPTEWARKAIALYEVYAADRIVAERNFGGDMVANTIRAENEKVAYKDVTASRGKMQRAEPIVALYEKGVVSHLGLLATLEDEMVTWVPGVTKLSPNRLDAVVWAITDLMLGDEVRYDTSMSWVNGAGITPAHLPFLMGGG